MKVCFYIDSLDNTETENLNIFFEYLIRNSNLIPLLIFENNNLKEFFFNNTFPNLNLEYECFSNFNNVESFINDFLLLKKIKKLVYFNGTCQVYYPVKIIDISELIKEKKIDFLWINNTFLKGRFSIFEDLYFYSSKLYIDYKKILTNKYYLKKTKQLDNFINQYWKYKNYTHYIGDFKKKRTLKDFFNRKNFKNLLNRIIFKNKIIRHKLPYHNKNKIILILLCNKNHWFNSYANSKIKIEKLISEIENRIPQGYYLYFKAHPKDSIPLWVLKRLKQKRSYMYEGYLIEAIKFSEIIIFTGTTSGFEAMTLRKKAIHIGKNSYISNIDGPIKIVKNIENLNNIFEEVINNKTPIAQINSYLLSLIKNSYPQMNTHKDSFQNRGEYFIKKVARIMITFIENKNFKN